MKCAKNIYKHGVPVNTLTTISLLQAVSGLSCSAPVFYLVSYPGDYFAAAYVENSNVVVNVKTAGNFAINLKVVCSGKDYDFQLKIKSTTGSASLTALPLGTQLKA